MAARPPWTLTYPPDTPRVEVAPGITVLSEFAYSVSPADVPLTATVHMRIRDGIAICERAEVERYDGKSLTAQDIRSVPFGTLISEAPQVAPIHIRDLHSDPDLAEGDPKLVLELVRRKVAPKQGIPVDLADVADVYRAALAAGKPPTAEVADVFGLSPRTASRRVADARKAGYLGKALDRRAGEKLGV